MKKNYLFLVMLMLLAFADMSIPVFAAEADLKTAVPQGWVTLIPPVVAIILAFVTKNVVISLFLGIFSGAFLLNITGGNVISASVQGFLDIVSYLLSSLADPWNAGIILQVLTIGGLIGLVNKMGGARAIAEALSKKATGPVSAQLITWALGLLVFFDDYANSLIVGPIMRPVTDKMQISRERLAFIVDATAAPIAGIALISTWVGYEVGLIQDAYESIGQNVNAYGVFVDTIPYRFYNILMLLFVFCTSLFLKDFGPMLKAERRARKHNQLLADDAKPMIAEDETLKTDEEFTSNIWNALIPIGSLIVFSFVGFYTNGYQAIMSGEDTALAQTIGNSPFSIVALRETFGASDASVVLFQAALIASLIALCMGVSQKLFSWGEGIDTWIEGMKSLLITGVILLLAWSLSGVISELGTADFLVSLLSDSMPAFLLPSVIFILGAVISFATGTSYGTMGILMPLAVPLAAALSSSPDFVVISAGAVLTGAIFGDHCSPISDTTILSSMGAGADHVAHVNTQLWYAVAVAVITILFGYIPVGLGVPIWLALPLSMVVIVLFVYFFGKRIDERVAE